MNKLAKYTAYPKFLPIPIQNIDTYPDINTDTNISQFLPMPEPIMILIPKYSYQITPLLISGFLIILNTDIDISLYQY